MVGLVVVSHSAALAAGVVELAREMGGAEVAIETAGGLADPVGAIGTDAELVLAAIGRAAVSGDGVLVLMDLGSAVMSAEMAAEMFAMESEARVLLCEAPLVEGAVAAAALAGAGAPLDEVAAEARKALGMKAALLGIEPAAPDAAPVVLDGAEVRLRVGNRLGLHARPAARIVETAARFEAQITIVDETRDRGPADARSLTALVMLGARLGDELSVRAAGPGADAALAALAELAASGFGDDDTAAPPAGAVPPAAVAAAPPAGAVPPGGGAPPPGAVPPAAAAAPPAPGARLRGVPAAGGIVIAPARRLGEVEVGDEQGPAGTPAEELARLDAARAAAKTDVEAARVRVVADAGEATAAIFDAHLALLDDSALLDPARRSIEGGLAAPAAWHAAAADVAASYRALDDPYLRERAADVDDVAGRVLQQFAGVTAASQLTEAGILVVRDLSPGDAAGLDRSLVQGLAVATGGATSHAAILARALGIPSVVGLGDAVLAIADGTPLVLDGDAGAVEVDPPAQELAAREHDRKNRQERQARARERAAEPGRTADGTAIEVAANVGSAAEVPGAVEMGADGIGLLRTEFLFLDRDLAPTEHEQREVYGEIARALGGRPLIVRTLDAGADKPLRFLPQAPEENPFLGVRGIRLGLANPELLDTQLRAIVAVAAEYPQVRVMFPMIATLAEYRAARAALETARKAAGAPPIEVGIMVEVPAVAVAAERFAREVDFFSIGTNDLTQYTMAAERGNAQLAPLLAGPQPPVLRLVAAVTAGAAAHGRWVGVCGELAGEPGAAVLLAGLGVSELSMAASRIPEVKDALRGVTLARARELAAQALDLDDAQAVAELLEAR